MCKKKYTLGRNLVPVFNFVPNVEQQHGGSFRGAPFVPQIVPTTSVQSNSSSGVDAHYSHIYYISFTT